MKCTPVITVAALALSQLNGADAFSSSFTVSSVRAVGVSSSSNVLTMEYIPSGLTKEQWRKIKEAEKKKIDGKNLGKVGVTSFNSRSLQDWQKSGGKNLFPVDPKQVKDPSEIPYM